MICYSRTVPGVKAADAVGLWFFPENPVWANPNGVEWNLPPHMAIYAVCFESLNRGTAERLHESLAGSVSYLGALEVGDSAAHKLLWSKLPPRCRIVHRAARVFWDGYPGGDRNEELFEQLENLGFDPVSWETFGGPLIEPGTAAPRPAGRWHAAVPVSNSPASPPDRRYAPPHRQWSSRLALVLGWLGL